MIQSLNIKLVEMRQKIGRKFETLIGLLRYRFITCDDLIRYSTIHIADDNDIRTMVAVHESNGTGRIEQYVELDNIVEGHGGGGGGIFQARL